MIAILGLLYRVTLHVSTRVILQCTLIFILLVLANQIKFSVCHGSIHKLLSHIIYCHNYLKTLAMFSHMTQVVGYL